jgi:hypothetical protein
VYDNCNQACSQRGASDCRATNTNLDGPITNLQNIKDKQAEQPTKKTCNTLPPQCIASAELPWLETNHFKKYIICKMVCATLQKALCKYSADFVALMRRFLAASVV